MSDRLARFERIVRGAPHVSATQLGGPIPEHPFELRNVHPLFPSIVRELFDDGHYSQATFEAFKFVDREVARLANHSQSGFKLMMVAFSEASPLVQLTPCSNTTEKDEQKGFQFLFAGSALAIRNPRGHEYALHDSPDECLDHLALASILLRRLEAAGFRLSAT